MAKKPAASPSPRRPASERSSPKTTRPSAGRRREPEPRVSTSERIDRTLDAFPDRIDVRDWRYQPTLTPLPNRIINCHDVPIILNQKKEGACTGFALAAVVNYLLGRRNIRTAVSPRMLYELARRYDEWPGENYRGSSARGAMKAWVRHGVCCEDSWTAEAIGLAHFTPAIAQEALEFPGGAFFRVMHRQVRDMHSALAETGILFCTLMVHSGWGEPSRKAAIDLTYDDREGNHHQLSLPVIRRSGRADEGHAVAIVGYTREGFIIQNSWGEEWGADGFALLPYDDYLMHATDVWVAQLGVPVATDLWVESKLADSTAGRGRVEEAIHLNSIRPYVIDIGNNGELSDSGNYWTTESDIERLFGETIPQQTEGWSKKRVLFYLHGGLNSEHDVARRVLAYRDVMLANEIYPIHIMWETGVMESLRGIINDVFTDDDDRAGGVAEWMRRFRDGLIEAKDRTFELTVASLGTELWDEMKENARLASRHPRGRGAIQLLRRRTEAAMKKLAGGERGKWELHVAAHSAGSIFAGHALPHLCNMGLPLKTIQLMAPAITIQDFDRLYIPAIDGKECPPPTLYILSDIGERDDDVGPYGKSLLYLVSNAFEGKRGTPLMGMERFLRGEEGSSADAYKAVRDLCRRKAGGHPCLVVAGAGTSLPDLSRSNSHGGFDNDPDTLNSILWRVLGRRPTRPFEVRDLQ